MTDLTDSGGKGSSQRPCKVPEDVFSLRYTMALGKTKEEREDAKKRLIEIGEINDD